MKTRNEPDRREGFRIAFSIKSAFSSSVIKKAGYIWSIRFIEVALRSFKELKPYNGKLERRVRSRRKQDLVLREIFEYGKDA
jgi:hypothetical protein